MTYIFNARNQGKHHIQVSKKNGLARTAVKDLGLNWLWPFSSEYSDMPVKYCLSFQHALMIGKTECNRLQKPTTSFHLSMYKEPNFFPKTCWALLSNGLPRTQ